jgi:hypothetical protein
MSNQKFLRFKNISTPPLIKKKCEAIVFGGYKSYCNNVCDEVIEGAVGKQTEIFQALIRHRGSLLLKQPINKEERTMLLER